MFTGAGILIIELYFGNPVITLFGFNGLNFSEPGGTREHGENIEDTAHREGREESANLVNLTKHELLQYSIPIYLEHYVGYAIYVENLSYEDYRHNVGIVLNHCNTPFWKETNSMTRIPVNNLIASVQSGTNYAYDTMGSTVHVANRTIALVKTGTNAILNLITHKPIPLYRHLVTNSRIPCLIGTYTYTMQSQSFYTQTVSIGNVAYAVYVAPNLTPTSHPFLVNCDKVWGGMHVTMAGYHVRQPQPQKFLEHISNSGHQPWTISVDGITTKGKTIYFTSHTLDSISKFMHSSGFKRIKGPKYSDTKWHIKSECSIPKDIKIILKHQTWSLVLVSKQNGAITWLNRYPLNIL